MFAIVIFALLVLFKILEMTWMEGISWWIISGLGLAIFLWFEYFERMLGLDKRKEHDHFEKVQKDRIKRQFEQDKKNRR